MLGDGCLNSDAVCRFKHTLSMEFEEQQKKFTLGVGIKSKDADVIIPAYLTAFYSYNIFLFGDRRGGDADLHKRAMAEIGGARDSRLSESEWRLLRDPLATRLLDFVDEPDWENRGSKFFRQNPSATAFQGIDKFRYLIKSICIMLNKSPTLDFVPDWDWPLQIDWTNLHRLEYLQLDLKTYSGYPWMQMGDYYAPEEYQAMLERGAERMKCLSLKKLTLIGLCSFCNWGNEDHERKMDALFRPAVRDGGVITFVDTPLECIPFQPVRIDRLGIFAPLPGIGKAGIEPREVSAHKWLPVQNSPIDENFLRLVMTGTEEIEPENSFMSVARRLPLDGNKNTKGVSNKLPCLFTAIRRELYTVETDLRDQGSLSGLLRV